MCLVEIQAISVCMGTVKDGGTVGYTIYIFHFKNDDAGRFAPHEQS